jgi:hypothetical protein
MPLRDHFHPPLSEVSSWEEVYGGWPMVIVQHLGHVLPPDYTAGPKIHLRAQVEVDVATFGSDARTASYAQMQASPGTTNAWAPADPTLVVEAELSDSPYRRHPAAGLRQDAADTEGVFSSAARLRLVTFKEAWQ